MSFAPLTPRRVFLWMKVAALVGIALLFLLLYKVGKDQGEGPAVILKKPQFHTQATYRKVLPVFEWDNNRGQTLGHSELKGQWTLLNFWANWCWPCHAELPLLRDAMADQLLPFQDKLRVILVNTDKDGSDHQRFAEELLIKNGLEKLNLFDPFGLLSQNFGVKEYPYHILVNPSGEIVYEQAGAIDWQAPEVLESFIKLLQASSAGAPIEPEASKSE